MSHAVRVVGWVSGSPDFTDYIGGPESDIGGDFKVQTLTRRLVGTAYERAGAGPEEIQVAQVHDPFGPLVDTSVLIDYFGARDNRESRILDYLLAEGPPPAIAPIIVQEYLQGLTVAEEFDLARSDLENFFQLPPPDYRLHLEAAESHRWMRRRGVTVPTIDTLIITVARAEGSPLLTRDRWQKELARFLDVQFV